MSPFSWCKKCCFIFTSNIFIKSTNDKFLDLPKQWQYDDFQIHCTSLTTGYPRSHLEKSEESFNSRTHMHCNIHKSVTRCASLGCIKPWWVWTYRYINNSLHLARKYTRIFARGHYLFWEMNSFPRAQLEENCELWETDNVHGQISEHNFHPK